jgi:hypothetical protein
MKIALDTFQKRVTELEMFRNTLGDQMKEFVKMRPIESSATIFTVGLIFGVVLGTFILKRKCDE